MFHKAFLPSSGTPTDSTKVGEVVLEQKDRSGADAEVRCPPALISEWVVGEGE